MAHRGLRWPLMFRREILLNAKSYQFGFANEYFLRAQGLLGTIGSTLNNANIRCSGPFVDDQLKTTWTSAPHVSGTAVIEFRLIAEIVGFPPINVARYEIHEATTGLLFARQFFGPPDSAAQGGLLAAPNATTTTETPPTLWDNNGSSAAYRPVLYGQ